MELAEDDLVRPERIRLNGIAPDAIERGVKLLDHIRPRISHHVSTVLAAAIVLIDGQIARKDGRPHRPVLDDDAFAHELEKQRIQRHTPVRSTELWQYSDQSRDRQGAPRNA